MSAFQQSRGGRSAAQYLPWTEFDSRRLRALILAMLPYSKIAAEFPGHHANAVRAAWETLFRPQFQLAVDRALYVLGDRARYCRRSATGLRLDGRPSSALQLVQEANNMLRGRKLALIPYVGMGPEDHDLC